ncbi:MAG: helix-turn-helix domain-containing protein, partial [Chitinophagaceae bacterium]|nr:helix-turn-helix domain-containing protein [Chitinophagaceae bacterium]
DISVSQETWENSRYVLNKADGKLEQETLGTFTQFPLRLAWAITIHKSQGLTFEKVMIDAGQAFSSGQVYVALSRCTSLDGIALLSKIPASSIYSNDHVIKGHQVLTHKGSLAERFAGAREIFTQQLLEEIFSFSEITRRIDLLQLQINENRDKLNKESIEWIEKLKNDFSVTSSIGLKFIRKIFELMKDEPVIEKNIALQKRINDAAIHFETSFLGYQKSIQNHPLVTEHKEVAVKINENLGQLLLSVFTTNYFLQYCKQPFSIPTFLAHKLKFKQPGFAITCYASSKNQSSSHIQNNELYDTLKRWRDMVCETGMPIYMVANQATLKEISTYLPFTKKDLLLISGFGKAKVDKYGDDILEAVAGYCERYSIETNMVAKAVNPKRERIGNKEIKTDTKVASFNLFKEGKTIAEIATERNFTTSTIEGHLAWFVGSGEIDINEIVPLPKQQLIRNAIKIHGALSHKTLMDNLPANISYGDIRLVSAAIKKI